MKREELVDKIENQHGWADTIDAFRIISVYTEIFGIRHYDNLSIEDELILMYDEIKKYNPKTYYDPNTYSKSCRECGEIKLLREFYKKTGARDGRDNRCSKCSLAYNQKRHRKNKLLKNEEVEN